LIGEASSTVRAEFSFAHFIPSKTASCRGVHGHSLTVVATFVSAESGFTESGEVLDRVEATNLLRDWLDENWNLAFLYLSDDFESTKIANGLQNGDDTNSTKLYALIWSPTFENLARYLGEVVLPSAFDSEDAPQVAKVELQEYGWTIASWVNLRTETP